MIFFKLPGSLLKRKFEKVNVVTFSTISSILIVFHYYFLILGILFEADIFEKENLFLSPRIGPYL